MLECYPGHTRCYSREQHCQYNLNLQTKTLMYYRNGKRLSNCKDLSFGTKFKCPMSYCIPFGYICDSKWDCWDGYDEPGCEIRNCFGLFSCRHSSVCIHIKDACDKYRDCPCGEDELHCDVTFCIPRCICLSKAIMCQHAVLASAQIQSFIFIDISYTKILYSNNIWQGIISTIIILRHNNLSTFYPFLNTWNLSSLVKVDLSSNLISHISKPL